MNERIRQLAAQANVKPLYSQQGFDPRYIFEQEQLEKFAQLIVQECMEEVMNYRVHNNPTREIVPFIVQDIKLHFGVEE